MKLARRTAWIGSSLMLWVSLVGSASAGAPSMRSDMPPEILSKRDVILSRQRYQELADEWRAYVEKNPRSAVAHVQLARALRYAGSGSPEEMNRLVQRAVEIDADCPEALDALADTGLHSASPLVSLDEAVQHARRAAQIAPGWSYPHFTLWSHLIVLGRFDEAQAELRAIRAAGGFPSPLLDFNYNLLVSAEPGAIVFTNGDNDTYPALALQAALGTRRDVAIVNLALLNRIEYAHSVWRQTFGSVGPFSEKEIDALRAEWENRGESPSSGGFAATMVQALMDKIRDDQWRKPVYFALTVAPSHLEACGQALELEGILLRVKEERRPPDEECCDYSLALQKTLHLFRDEFRLESATDLAYAWTPESAIRPLMTNYAAVLRIVASESAERQDLDTVRYALGKAIGIVDFHGDKALVHKLATYWKELDPNNADVNRWL